MKDFLIGMTIGFIIGGGIIGSIVQNIHKVSDMQRVAVALEKIAIYVEYNK